MKMQIGRSDIRNIVNIISQRYLFSNNKELWDEIKNSLLNVESIGVDALDRILAKMGDVHLRLNKFSKPSELRICPIEQDGGELFYMNRDKRHRVLRLGDFTVDEILNQYAEFFFDFPRSMVLVQIIQDFQYGRFIFENCNTIKTEAETISIKTVSTEEYLNQMPKNLNIQPVIVTEIDQQTIMIKLLSFNMSNMVNLLKLELDKFEVSKYQKIIIDIRDNPGGSITEASLVTEFFVPGEIQYPYIIRDINGNEEKRIINGTNNLGVDISTMQVFVFINENTASAAEYIFLEGLKQAFGDSLKLIGRQTQGTSGQATVYKVSDGIFLNATNKRYYDSGGNELKNGYEPDIKIDITFDLEWKDIFIEMYKEVSA